jgi:hypothetical protein
MSYNYIIIQLKDLKMRYFPILVLFASATLCIQADQYTIQLIATKQQKSIEVMQQMVPLCKGDHQTHTSSNGYKVLTCGRYDSYADAAKDLPSIRKIVSDAFIRTHNVSKNPILKQEQKSVKTPVVKDKPKTQEMQVTPKIQETSIKKEAPVVTGKPKAQKIQEPKVQEIKAATQKTEEQDVQTEQVEMEETPLRLINITPEASIMGQSQKEEEVVQTNK